MKNPNAWYGFRRDSRDPRDHHFVPGNRMVPDMVDLRGHCPPVMDQGDIGSCTAHGIIGAMRYEMIKRGATDTELSRLFLYYAERAMEGTIASDAGAEIRDGIKAVSKLGVCRESLWPYKVKKFATKPPAKCTKDALQFGALSYQRVNVARLDLMYALAAGYTPIIGITVFEEFESDEVAKTGFVPMPTAKSKPVGGHCMFVVGYRMIQNTLFFIVQNSWASDWGDRGFCYIPSDYLGSPKYGGDYWLVSAEGSLAPAGKVAA